MIKKLLSLSVLSLTIGLGASCGSSDSSMSETEACNQLVATLCTKMFNCYTAAELTLVQSTVGLNVADCKTKLGAQQCNADAVKCDIGETYHADKAAECVTQYKGLSCTDIKTVPMPTPAACDLICSK